MTTRESPWPLLASRRVVWAVVLVVGLPLSACLLVACFLVSVLGDVADGFRRALATAGQFLTALEQWAGGRDDALEDFLERRFRRRPPK